MKALIMDYSDGTLLVLPIPQEWETSAEEFVTAHPCYCDSTCYYMIVSDNVDVYNVVRDGEDADGYPCYDYEHATTL